MTRILYLYRRQYNFFFFIYRESLLKATMVWPICRDTFDIIGVIPNVLKPLFLFKYFAAKTMDVLIVCTEFQFTFNISHCFSNRKQTSNIIFYSNLFIRHIFRHVFDDIIRYNMYSYCIYIMAKLPKQHPLCF